MPQSARVAPARGVAFDLLLRVEVRKSFAAELLHSNLLTGLSSSDRALTTELVMGVLRWQRKLDAAAENTAGKSIAKFDLEVKIALRLGAYQLLFLDRIPARAAVNESVELVKLHGKRSAAPLVNAVLRKISIDSATVLDSATGISHAFSHPLWLVERWVSNYGLDRTRGIGEYNQQRPITTVRFVSRPTNNLAPVPSSANETSPTSSYATDPYTEDSIRSELAREHIDVKPAPIVVDAWQVVRGEVTQTAAYREHRLAIQDEGSQLVALLAKGKTILDCCAAPGGKSAIAAERNPSSLIVSMDRHLNRVRLTRQLTGSRAALAGDARQLPFAQRFDCVIADLPCSGTGTLSRNPEIKCRLQPEDLPRLAELQLEILRSVAQQAKRIVYSTCSLEPEESEEVIAKFLSDHRNFRLLPIAARLEELARQKAIHPQSMQSLIHGDFLRTIPGIHNCDGFFAAILESD